jgi:hypothetical protein
MSATTLVVLGAYCILFMLLAGIYLLVLVRLRSPGRNPRLFVIARIVQLVLSVLILVLFVIAHSLLAVVALLVLFAAMSWYRRTLRRHELGAP